MKQLILVPCLLLGPGILISCKRSTSATPQSSQPTARNEPKAALLRVGKLSTNEDPFQRYLEDEKTHWTEPSFARFAHECGVDPDSTTARYAQSPSEKWVPVKDLSNAQSDQQTDFYGTLAVWHAADKALVEQWGMELDTGNYTRKFICLEKAQVVLAEEIDWTIPPVATKKERAAQPAWGYRQRWKVKQNGEYEKAAGQFVDVFENPMKAPKLDAETRTGLNSDWQEHTWRDLDYPDALLG